MERETGFEPATSTLARSHSTTELLPPAQPEVAYHAVESPIKLHQPRSPSSPNRAGHHQPVPKALVTTSNSGLPSRSSTPTTSKRHATPDRRLRAR